MATSKLNQSPIKQDKPEEDTTDRPEEEKELVTQPPINMDQQKGNADKSGAENEQDVITLNTSSDSLLNSAASNTEQEEHEDSCFEASVSDTTLIQMEQAGDTKGAHLSEGVATRRAKILSTEKGHYVSMNAHGKNQLKLRLKKTSTKDDSEEKDKCNRKLTENEGAINRLTLELNNEERKGKEREKKMAAMETLVGNLKRQKKDLTKDLNDTKKQL